MAMCAPLDGNVCLPRCYGSQGFVDQRLPLPPMPCIPKQKNKRGEQLQRPPTPTHHKQRGGVSCRDHLRPPTPTTTTGEGGSFRDHLRPPTPTTTTAGGGAVAMTTCAHPRPPRPQGGGTQGWGIGATHRYRRGGGQDSRPYMATFSNIFHRIPKGEAPMQYKNFLVHV